MPRTSSLERQLTLLAACARSPLRFRDARELMPDAPASTVARLLRGLAAADLVRARDGRYVPGPGATALAMQVLGRPDGGRFQPAVDLLAQQTGCSAACWLREGRRIVLVAKRELPDAFHYIDLHASRGLGDTAFGQAVRARLRRELVEPDTGYWRLAEPFRAAAGVEGAIGISAFARPVGRRHAVALAAAAAARRRVEAE